MRLKLLLIAVIVLGSALVARAGDNILRDNWKWNKSGKCQYGSIQIELFNSHQSISAVRFRRGRLQTDIKETPGALADSLSALCEATGAVAAVNGSYFNVKTLQSNTFVRDEGKNVSNDVREEESRVDALLYIGKKKVFISPYDYGHADLLSEKYPNAVSSGPLLLQNGEFFKQEWPNESFFSKRHPRTIVGTVGRWVYFIVIDGRFPNDGIGTTIRETAEIAKMFGLKDAINLDGGGSSTLWARGLGVISHPYDNKRYDNSGQRIVPNFVYAR